MNNKLLLLMISLPVSIKACESLGKADELVIAACAQQVTGLKIEKCHEAIRRIKAKATGKEEKYKEIIRKWYVHDQIPKEIPEIEQFHALRKLAISSHYTPILRHLLEKKIVDADSKFEGHCRVCRLLSEAAFHKSYEGIEVLLEFGADPNQKACNFEECVSWQESPLFTAVDARDNRMLSILLSKKADPNKHYPQSRPLPLMRALQNCKPNDLEDVESTQEMVATLLKYGANPDEKEPDYILHELSHEKYSTPRELATKCGYTNILALFDNVKKK